MQVLPRVLADPALDSGWVSRLRAQLGIDDAFDDTLLATALLSARGWIEQSLGRPIALQPVRAVFEAWPNGWSSGGGWREACTIELTMPVESVDEIFYTGPDQVVAPWTEFVARVSQGGVTRVRPAAGASWPQLGDDPVINLNATAGFPVVPEAIVQAVMIMAAFLHGNRDGLGDARLGAGRLPGEVAQLIAPWRFRWLG